jgi:hypothetical protein
MSIFKLAVAFCAGIIAVLSFDRLTRDSPLLSITSDVCDAPSGAMSAVSYQEMFIGKLHDIKFGCVPIPRGICSAYSCTEFTALDFDDKHVIGYVWRNVMNIPQLVACSPDGGKSGTFYGECPVGTPVATVYHCPWCEPDLNAIADMRGKR